MTSPIVFFDLAGPDGNALRTFYAQVFNWACDDAGQFEVSVTAPLGGSIREDPAEKRIYLGVDDVAGTLERVAAHGGSVDQPRFEVPGVVVLGLFRDPAGNPMGLVEMEGTQPKVP